MKKNTIIKLGLLCVVFSIAMAACSKKDATYKDFIKGGEIRYSARPDSIQLFPGQNRIKLSLFLVSAPNVVLCKIFWNNGSDSIEIPVKQVAESDTNEVSAIIDNLEEGVYTFNIYTYDQDGKSSVKSDTVGVVYGEVFINSLINKPIEKATYVDGRPTIIWGADPGEKSLAVEMKYKNKDGEPYLLRILSSDSVSVTVLDNKLQGDSIQYRTLFLPDSNAIDTFHTEYQTVKVIPEPVELDVSKFSDLYLPGDAEPFNNNHLVSILWNGNLASYSWYRSIDNTGTLFSFDMGVTAKLTTATFWQRGVISEHDLLYANANLKVWEVYGRTEIDGTGDLGKWTLLLTCRSVKPSGSPIGQNTKEDIDHARGGESFTFPENSSPVRYIRIKVLDNWESWTNDHTMLQGLKFFGIEQ